MLGKLLALAIVAIIAYYALTEALPWIKSRMAPDTQTSTEASGSHFCIDRAAAAGSTVTDGLVANARPPVDTEVWGRVLVRVEGNLAEAERACSCPTAACGKASESIDELRAMVDFFDEIARGNPLGISNPATRMERVNQLLDEARQMARSE